MFVHVCSIVCCKTHFPRVNQHRRGKSSFSTGKQIIYKSKSINVPFSTSMLADPRVFPPTKRNHFARRTAQHTSAALSRPRADSNMSQSQKSKVAVHIIPICSMYGIYGNIGGILMVNVTIYSIHGSYGKCYKCSIFLYPQFTGFPIKNHRGNGWFPGLLALRNASVMGRGTTCYEIFLRGMEDPRSRNCFVTLGGKFPRLFSQLLSSCASQLVGFASMRTEHDLYVYITVYVYRYIWVN